MYECICVAWFVYVCMLHASMHVCSYVCLCVCAFVYVCCMNACMYMCCSGRVARSVRSRHWAVLCCALLREWYLYMYVRMCVCTYMCALSLFFSSTFQRCHVMHYWCVRVRVRACLMFVCVCVSIRTCVSHALGSVMFSTIEVYDGVCWSYGNISDYSDRYSTLHVKVYPHLKICKLSTQSLDVSCTKEATNILTNKGTVKHGWHNIVAAEIFFLQVTWYFHPRLCRCSILFGWSLQSMRLIVDCFVCLRAPFFSRSVHTFGTSSQHTCSTCPLGNPHVCRLDAWKPSILFHFVCVMFWSRSTQEQVSQKLRVGHPQCITGKYTMINTCRPPPTLGKATSSFFSKIETVALGQTFWMQRAVARPAGPAPIIPIFIPPVEPIITSRPLLLLLRATRMFAKSDGDTMKVWLQHNELRIKTHTNSPSTDIFQCPIEGCLGAMPWVEAGNKVM